MLLEGRDFVLSSHRVWLVFGVHRNKLCGGAWGKTFVVCNEVCDYRPYLSLLYAQCFLGGRKGHGFARRNGWVAQSIIIGSADDSVKLIRLLRIHCPNMLRPPMRNDIHHHGECFPQLSRQKGEPYAARPCCETKFFV